MSLGGYVAVSLLAAAAIACGRIGYDPTSCSIHESPLVLGFSHGCLIRGDNSLWCWGNGSSGQIGIASSADQLSPVPVGSAKWRMITVGKDNTCGIQCDGSLWCWGLNDDGDLGLGDSGIGTERAIPTQVGSLTTWHSIKIGRSHSCALREEVSDELSLWCWGRNGAKQLGVGDNTERTTPTQVRIPSAPNRDLSWSSIGPSNDHTCATQSDGSLWCWGSSSNGQLGQDGALPLREIPNLVAAPSESYQRTFGGIDFSCATNTAENLFCWGRNEVGQLGLGDIIDRGLPTPVPSAETWISVDSQTNHVCGVLSTGELQCWGDQVAGELGHGVLVSTEPTPVPVPGLSDVAHVAVGANVSCAQQTNPERLWCWGKGDNGRSGLGDSTDVTTPQQVNLPALP